MFGHGFGKEEELGAVDGHDEEGLGYADEDFGYANEWLGKLRRRGRCWAILISTGFGDG
jgi:hypothetical protein